MSEETKRKLSLSKMGHSVSVLTREKIAKAHIGRPSWNKGLSKETDGRIDYVRPTTFSKGIVPWNKGIKSPYVVWNKGKQLSLEHKESLRGKRPKASGANNHNWKGGTTPLNQKIRESFEMKLWRRAVFERDDYTCIWCGARSGVGKKVIIHADHIKPFAQYPELRFAIDNGRTLCIDCHKKTGTWGRYKKP